MKQSYRVALAASLLTLFASPAFAYHGMHGSPDRPAWSTGMPYSGNQAGWDRWHHHRHGPWMHPRHYRPLPPPPRFYGPPHRGMKGMRPYGPMGYGMPYHGPGKTGATRKGAYGPQKHGQPEAAAAGNSIAAVAQAAGSFNTLLAAATAGGLAEGAVENLLQPENRAELERLLQHHIVSGRLPADEVLASESLETLAGTTLQVKLNGEQAQIGGAEITATDVMASIRCHAMAACGQQVWLRLRPTAVSRLQAITQQHQGELLELTVAGHQTLKSRINESAGPGVIQINDPDPVLRQELLALQHQLLQGDGSC